MEQLQFIIKCQNAIYRGFRNQNGVSFFQGTILGQCNVSHSLWYESKQCLVLWWSSFWICVVFVMYHLLLCIFVSVFVFVYLHLYLYQISETEAVWEECPDQWLGFPNVANLLTHYVIPRYHHHSTYIHGTNTIVPATNAMVVHHSNTTEVPIMIVPTVIVRTINGSVVPWSPK